jgi:hypothetical protein
MPMPTRSHTSESQQPMLRWPSSGARLA